MCHMDNLWLERARLPDGIFSKLCQLHERNPLVKGHGEFIQEPVVQEDSRTASKNEKSPCPPVSLEVPRYLSHPNWKAKGDVI